MGSPKMTDENGAVTKVRSLVPGSNKEIPPHAEVGGDGVNNRSDWLKYMKRREVVARMRRLYLVRHRVSHRPDRAGSGKPHAHKFRAGVRVEGVNIRLTVAQSLGGARIRGSQHTSGQPSNISICCLKGPSRSPPAAPSGRRALQPLAAARPRTRDR